MKLLQVLLRLEIHGQMHRALPPILFGFENAFAMKLSVESLCCPSFNPQRALSFRPTTQLLIALSGVKVLERCCENNWLHNLNLLTSGKELQSWKVPCHSVWFRLGVEDVGEVLCRALRQPFIRQ